MAIADFALNVLKFRTPGLLTEDFFVNIRRVTGEDDYTFNEHGIRPDAYSIDEEKEEIHLYEIEDTSEITREKLKKFAWLWFCLDECEWDLFLHICDRYGNQKSDVNLCVAYYSYLSRSPESADD